MAVVVDGYELVQPEGHTRRRLLFINRQIIRGSKEFILFAGTQIQIPYVRKQIRVEWHTNETYFIAQGRINRANEIVQQKLKDPKITPFGPFKVIIPSLLCIGFMEPEAQAFVGRIPSLTRRTQEYFEHFLRKQIGSHIFVDIFGKLCHLCTFVQQNNYRVSSIAYISSIYPCIRYAKNEKPPEPQLLFGLQYKYFGNNWNTGNRYYHRWDEYEFGRKVEAGGVSEITLAQLNNLEHEMRGNPNQRYFGLFVCVGAKLFVVDNCMEVLPNDDSKHTHSRSLIQQGGMVFIETDILSFRENGTFNRFTKYGFDFFNTMEHVYVDPVLTTPKEQLRTFQNPIIFLGAVDSAFNTIAWRLHVTYRRVGQGPPPKYDRIYDLFLPEGARIVAIADGLNGIREIRQRVYYEMLHDSVLTQHKTEFRIFDVNAVKNILNLNDCRSLNQKCQHIETPTENNYEPQRIPPIPLFKEFNVRILTGYNPNFNYQTRYTRLPVPPMYPPLIIDNQLKYIPNRDMREPVENSYPKKDAIIVPPNPYNQLYTFKRGVQKQTIYCSLIEYPTPDYDWYRSNNPNTPLAAVDGINQRIGVDGWVWQKYLHGESRFQLKTTAYYHRTVIDPVPNPPDHRSRRSGDRGQRSDDRSRRSGDRGQRSDDRGRRSRDRGSHGGGQSSEGRRRRPSGDQSSRKKRKH